MRARDDVGGGGNFDGKVAGAAPHAGMGAVARVGKLHGVGAGDGEGH